MSLCEKYFNVIKFKIKDYKHNGYALMTEMWTDDYFNFNYLAVATHYVKAKELKHGLLALKAMERAKSTSENIK